MLDSSEESAATASMDQILVAEAERRFPRMADLQRIVEEYREHADLDVWEVRLALVEMIAGAWDRYRHARWRIVLQGGLIPVTIGLVCASALVVAQAADTSLVAVAITLVTAALTFFTRINPLWALAGAALLGLAGVV